MENKGYRRSSDLHIGNLIKQELEHQGRSITWLAKQVGCSRENLYKVFRRSWIYTDLLFKISDALDYNFFRVCYEFRETQKKQLDREQK